MASRRADPPSVSAETARLAVPLGRRPVAGGEAGARLRLVLETEPGSVPWRPELGVDLSSLVGRPATVERLAGAERAVMAALTRWMPEASVLGVKARAVTPLGAGGSEDLRALPVAEAALTPLGASCLLSLDIELATSDGPLTLTATLSP